MELGSGYKQTEVGLIPNDWEAMEIDHLGEIIDGDRGKNYPNSGDLKNDGYCIFLSAKNVTKTGFRFDDCQFITKEKDKRLGNGKLIRGDIILTTRGTVGNIAFFDNLTPHENIRINSGMVIIRLNIRKKVKNEYFYNLCQSDLLATQIDRIAFGSAQPQLTVKGISTLQFPLPPSETEQTAIANALSDAEALIQSLEKLIAKKRLIKHGAMQELLNCKRRLPGFAEKWEISKLEKLFCVTSGGGKEIRENSQGQYFIMEMGSVSEEGKLILNKTTNNSINLLSIGDLVMPTRDIGEGRIIGKVAIIDKDNSYVLGNNIYSLSAKNYSLDVNFFHYLINTESVNSALKKKITKSVQLALNKSYVEEQEILFPTTKEEQTAIANVFSDIDAEIEALEQKLAKYNQIKQGMMQNLLTGRIRLI